MVLSKDGALLQRSAEILTALLEQRDREAIRGGHPMGDDSPVGFRIREFLSLYKKHLGESKPQQAPRQAVR